MVKWFWFTKLVFVFIKDTLTIINTKHVDIEAQTISAPLYSYVSVGVLVVAFTLWFTAHILIPSKYCLVTKVSIRSHGFLKTRKGLGLSFSKTR